MRRLVSRVWLTLLLCAAGCRPGAVESPHTPNDWLRISRDCENGAPAACAWLGMELRRSRSFPRARALLEQSCAANDGLGCGGLALMSEAGEGAPVDHARAIALNERGCTLGSGMACQNLGVYLNTDGAPVEVLARVVDAFDRGCRLGRADSCCALADANLKGWVDGGSRAKARALFEANCPAEDVCCTQFAAEFGKEDPDAGIAALQRGCARGGSWSCRYNADWEVDAGRLHQALRYYRTACFLGDGWSCREVADVCRAADPPCTNEARVVAIEVCERHTVDEPSRREFCVLGEWLGESRDAGPGPEARAHYVEWCDGGWGMACERLCLLGGKVATTPECRYSCAAGYRGCPRDGGSDGGSIDASAPDASVFDAGARDGGRRR